MTRKAENAATAGMVVTARRIITSSASHGAVYVQASSPRIPWNAEVQLSPELGPSHSSSLPPPNLDIVTAQAYDALQTQRPTAESVTQPPFSLLSNDRICAVRDAAYHKGMCMMTRKREAKEIAAVRTTCLQHLRQLQSDMHDATSVVPEGDSDIPAVRPILLMSLVSSNTVVQTVFEWSSQQTLQARFKLAARILISLRNAACYESSPEHPGILLNCFKEALQDASDTRCDLIHDLLPFRYLLELLFEYSPDDIQPFSRAECMKWLVVPFLRSDRLQIAHTVIQSLTRPIPSGNIAPFASLGDDVTLPAAVSMLCDAFSFESRKEGKMAHVEMAGKAIDMLFNKFCNYDLSVAIRVLQDRLPWHHVFHLQTYCTSLNTEMHETAKGIIDVFTWLHTSSERSYANECERLLVLAITAPRFANMLVHLDYRADLVESSEGNKQDQLKTVHREWKSAMDAQLPHFTDSELTTLFTDVLPSFLMKTAFPIDCHSCQNECCDLLCYSRYVVCMGISNQNARNSTGTGGETNTSELERELRVVVRICDVMVALLREDLKNGFHSFHAISLETLLLELERLSSFRECAGVQRSMHKKLLRSTLMKIAEMTVSIECERERNRVIEEASSVASPFKDGSEYTQETRSNVLQIFRRSKVTDAGFSVP